MILALLCSSSTLTVMVVSEVTLEVMVELRDGDDGAGDGIANCKFSVSVRRFPRLSTIKIKNVFTCSDLTMRN